MAWRLALIAFTLLLAGCATPAVDDATTTAATDDATTTLAAFDLAGRGCIEAGGHSVHPRSLWEKGQVSVVPEPWVPADVWDDVGPQLTFSEVPDPERPIPEKGNTMGNYHATTWCDAWAFRGVEKPDMFFGWVGMKVEAPTFLPDDAPTHQYVVTVLATNDDDVLAALHDAGFAAFKATATRETMPDGTLRIQMMTEGNGNYDSLFKPSEAGESVLAHARLWWQRAPDGAHHEHDEGAHAEGAFQPIALDMLSTGGTHFVAEAQGYFSHSGTDHHAPLPGAYGHTAAMMHDGFDRVFSFGPQPDVMLDVAYVH